MSNKKPSKYAALAAARKKAMRDYDKITRLEKKIEGSDMPENDAWTALQQTRDTLRSSTLPSERHLYNFIAEMQNDPELYACLKDQRQYAKTLTAYVNCISMHYKTVNQIAAKHKGRTGAAKSFDEMTQVHEYMAEYEACGRVHLALTGPVGMHLAQMIDEAITEYGIQRGYNKPKEGDAADALVIEPEATSKQTSEVAEPAVS